jgi:hypothetical protein
MNEYGLILKQEIISIDNVRQDYIVGILHKIHKVEQNQKLTQK